MTEHQNIEYKISWRDEYLKWICGFANANGGKLYIGIDDNGNITGLEDYKKLMDDIPNKTVNYLGLVVDVNLHKKDGKHYIEIDIPVSTVPVSFHGAYHYRSGSTKQELKGTALQHFLLKKLGKSWESIPVPDASLDDLDNNVIQTFIRRALKKGRISENVEKDNITTLLKNLRLINKEGHLTNAALLLFGKDPGQYFITAIFKIGRFGKSPTDLKFQDIVEGNIFQMADQVLEILKTKYLIRPISYEGLQRIEPLEYPEDALREAIFNSVIHKDYASTYIFLRVYDDRLTLFNPGGFPEGFNIERIKSEHISQPRNAIIADIFFKAGYIEAWGRGITKIIEDCREAGLPEPVIREQENGVHITFLKDIYTEEYLKTLDLNERQIKAMLNVKAKGEITNIEYRQLNGVSDRTALRDLQELTNMQLLERIGAIGRGTVYILKKRNLNPS